MASWPSRRNGLLRGQPPCATPAEAGTPRRGALASGRDAGAALRALASTGRCAVYYDFVVRYCSATERTAVDEQCRARLTVSGPVPDAGLRPRVRISRPSELSGSMRDCRSPDAHPTEGQEVSNPMEQSRRQSPDIPGGRGLTAGPAASSGGTKPGGGKGMGWLLLAPIACCGGPLLIAAVAAAGAAAWGGVGAALLVALAVTIMIVSRRRRRAAACCGPDVSAADASKHPSLEGERRRYA